jgi:hypothetical protein
MATIMGSGVGGSRRAMAWFRLPWGDGRAGADTRPGTGEAHEPVDIDLDALASLPSVHWLGALGDPDGYGGRAAPDPAGLSCDDDWRTRPAVTLRSGASSP